MATFTTLRKVIAGSVAEIVLNRPAALNAMNARFFEEIHTVFQEVEKDPNVNCAVLWAEGRMFTAGLDLKEAASLFTNDNCRSKAEQSAELYKHIKQLQQAFDIIRQNRKPTIAAIHGQCIGGGIDLVSACDIRLSTEDATFSIAETKMAIVADLGTLQRISRIVGTGIAREMAFTSNPINAQRALSCGLVNNVFQDKEKLLEGARHMAQTIANNSPLVVQGTKQVLNYSEEHSTADSLEYVALWNTSFLQSDDLTEAATSFFTKAPPKFRNRL